MYRRVRHLFQEANWVQKEISKGQLLSDKDFLYLEVTRITPDLGYILFSISCGLRELLAQRVFDNTLKLDKRFMLPLSLRSLAS